VPGPHQVQARCFGQVQPHLPLFEARPEVVQLDIDDPTRTTEAALQRVGRYAATWEPLRENPKRRSPLVAWIAPTLDQDATLGNPAQQV
jgi:hypothetical protein